MQSTNSNHGPGIGVELLTLATIVIVAFLLGFHTKGYLQSKGQTKSQESPAAQFQQDDSSIVLERAPSAPSPAPHEIPKGGKEERRIELIVKPAKGIVGQIDSVKNSTENSTENSKDSITNDSCECPPVEIALSMVRMPDGSMRAVASSANGQVIGGLDMPILEPPQAALEKAWTGQVLLAIDGESVRPGIGLERRLLKRMRAGAGLVMETSLRRPLMLASIGVDF